MTLNSIIEYKGYTLSTRRMRSGLYRGVVTTPDFRVRETAADFSTIEWAQQAAKTLADRFIVKAAEEA